MALESLSKYVRPMVAAASLFAASQQGCDPTRGIVGGPQEDMAQVSDGGMDDAAQAEDLLMNDFATAIDMAMQDQSMDDMAQPDLAMADLSANDLAVNDLATNDLSARDLAMKPDMSVVRDMQMPPDLVTLPDFSVLPDFSELPDMSSPDLSGPPVARIQSSPCIKEFFIDAINKRAISVIDGANDGKCTENKILRVPLVAPGEGIVVYVHDAANDNLLDIQSNKDWWNAGNFSAIAPFPGSQAPTWAPSIDDITALLQNGNFAKANSQVAPPNLKFQIPSNAGAAYRLE